MRNLSVREVNEHKLDLDDGLPITAKTFDASTNDLICAFGPTTDKPIITLRRCPAGLGDAAQLSVITSWDAPSPLPDLPCDSILSLHYFHESSTACLVLEGGDLIFVREKPLPDHIPYCTYFVSTPLIIPSAPPFAPPKIPTYHVVIPTRPPGPKPPL